MQGKSGINTQGSVTIEFPFCSLIPFLYSFNRMNTKWHNSRTPLANPNNRFQPQQGEDTNTLPATGQISCEGSTLKDRKQQHPFLSILLCFSAKGSMPARLHISWWVLYLQGLTESLSFVLHISELAAECRKKPGTYLFSPWCRKWT